MSIPAIIILLSLWLASSRILMVQESDTYEVGMFSNPFPIIIIVLLSVLITVIIGIMVMHVQVIISFIIIIDTPRFKNISCEMYIHMSSSAVTHLM